MTGRDRQPAGRAPSGAGRRLLFVVSDAGFFLSHRMPIALAAQKAGYEVAVACPDGPRAGAIAGNGVEHLPILLERRSMGPLTEARCLISIFSAIRRFSPDLVHLITAKPIFYGGLSARVLRVPALAAVTGMGFVYTHDTTRTKLLRRIANLLYRLALNRPACHALFQNGDDLAIAEANGFIRKAGHSIIGGSGADLARIRAAPLPPAPPVVVLPARMLRDKGVFEFVEAARMLRARGSGAVFRLLGDPDPGNPGSVTLQQLQDWQTAGVVEWHPHTADISGALARCHLVVLPTYREGFPKTLIDAAAAGRAAVASDIPGCRDAIVAGRTGLLFPARDTAALAGRIEELLADPGRLEAMGRAARAHAEEHFDIADVCRRHLEIYAGLTGGDAGSSGGSGRPARAR